MLLQDCNAQRTQYMAQLKHAKHQHYHLMQLIAAQKLVPGHALDQVAFVPDVHVISGDGMGGGTNSGVPWFHERSHKMDTGWAQRFSCYGFKQRQDLHLLHISQVRGRG
jgi:hypothetical protein